MCSAQALSFPQLQHIQAFGLLIVVLNFYRTANQKLLRAAKITTSYTNNSTNNTNTTR